MIGWHWTGLTNWESIQRDGAIKEYVLDKLDGFVPEGTRGVMAFTEGPTSELDEVGCVCFQSTSKRQLQVVLLRIKYNDPEDTLELPDYAHLVHDGHFGVVGSGDEWPYHLRKPMVVLRGPVPLSRVALVKTYDLLDVARHARTPTAERSAP